MYIYIKNLASEMYVQVGHYIGHYLIGLQYLVKYYVNLILFTLYF